MLFYVLYIINKTHKQAILVCAKNILISGKKLLLCAKKILLCGKKILLYAKKIVGRAEWVARMKIFQNMRFLKFGQISSD